MKYLTPTLVGVAEDLKQHVDLWNFIQVKGQTEFYILFSPT